MSVCLSVCPSIHPSFVHSFIDLSSQYQTKTDVSHSCSRIRRLWHRSSQVRTVHLAFNAGKQRRRQDRLVHNDRANMLFREVSIVYSRTLLFPPEMQLELEYWAETGELNPEEACDVSCSSTGSENACSLLLCGVCCSST